MGVSKLPDGAQLEVLEQAARQGCAWQPTPGTFLHDWKSATEVEGSLQYKVYKRAALRGTKNVWFPTLGLPQSSPRPCQLTSVNHTFHWLRAAKDVRKGVKPATSVQRV